tara:strand:+ start:375 stop:494 length:120 start_codon:yes stop_codon:yes gene_type:complete
MIAVVLLFFDQAADLENCGVICMGAEIWGNKHKSQGSDR